MEPAASSHGNMIPMYYNSRQFALEIKRVVNMLWEMTSMIPPYYNTLQFVRDIKRVMDLLWESRQSFTAEQIYEACGVDVKGNTALFQHFADARNVIYHRNHYTYQCKYNNVRDKTQLFSLIRAKVEGVSLVHLKASYPTAMKDIQALKDSGHIWLLGNAYLNQEMMVYPRNDLSISVDDDLKTLFRSIELPTDMSRVPGAKSAKKRTTNSSNILNKPEPKKKFDFTTSSSWKLLIT